MQAFVMFGNYTAEAATKISADRTSKLNELVKKHGGELRSIYALLGKPDLLVTVELPGVKEATQLSLALTRVTGISFTTAAAVPVEEFDKLASKG